MFCTNCGKELSDTSEKYIKILPDGTKVCSNCGFNLENFSQSEAVLNQNGQAYSGSSQDFNSNLNKNNISFQKYTKPLTTANFFFAQILFLIPILNIFFIIYWSFKKNININLKAYARSMFIWMILTTIFFIFTLLTFAFIQFPLSFNLSFNR